MLIGIAQLRAARVGQSRQELALISADLLLLTVILTVPNPLAAESWPTAFQYRFEGFIYFFIFLAASTLAYSWRTVAEHRHVDGDHLACRCCRCMAVRRHLSRAFRRV